MADEIVDVDWDTAEGPKEVGDDEKVPTSAGILKDRDYEVREG